MTAEPARAAYEAYAGALGINRSQGGRTWDDLPADRTAAWHAVAAVGPAAAIAAYARRCLAALRPERDWFRAAVTKLEAAGETIVLTGTPEADGDPWTITDWRTGDTLATVAGGQDAYEQAWPQGWTDVSWIGSWYENAETDGAVPLDWPESLPPPPDPALPGPPPWEIPGVPRPLAWLLAEAIEDWLTEPRDAVTGALGVRTAEAAELTGWTAAQVLACTGSYLAMSGEKFMALGEQVTAA